MQLKHITPVVAVVAGILGTLPAQALNVAGTNGAQIQLNITGASAARDSFLAFIRDTLCVGAGTDFNAYRGDTVAQTTSNLDPDFRVYSCTLSSSANVSASIQGKTAAIYYRSEGGSVYGPGPIVKNLSVKRLQLTAAGLEACTVAASPAFGLCPMGVYDLATDTAPAPTTTNPSSNLIAAQTDLGISDVEPNKHLGQNWPLVSPLGTEPTFTALNALPAQTLFGQPFGIIVSASSPLTTINRSEVTAILTGSYGTWSQVPSAASAGLGSGNIKVCVREDGSGSGTTAKIYFLNQGCGNDLVSGPGTIFGNEVQVNSTTANMEACVQQGNDWIGIPVNSRPAASSGTKFLTLNGINGQSELNAATGLYDYSYEATGTIRPSLPVGDIRTLATDLVTAIRKAANVPNGSGGAFAIANGGVNTPVLPIASPLSPLAVVTRDGNSCAKQNGVN